MNKLPRGTAADGWGTHFALPVVRGDPSEKTDAVEQALTEEVLDGAPCMGGVAGGASTQEGQTSLGGAAD
eukprot:9060703-Pyramimonas_sp.AAC.1